MSLTFDVPALSKHYTALEYKVYYLFGNEDTKYEAWYDGISSPTNDETTAYEKYSGKTVSIVVKQNFIPSFQTTFDYDFQAKMSGACLEDYSSGVGGFCLLEDNSNAMTAGSTAVTDFYNVANGDGRYTLTVTQNTRAIKIYRSAKSVFDTFDTLWADSTAVLSDGNKDGRIYFNAVSSGEVSTSSPSIEYLDYPFCELTGGGTTDDVNGYWTCLMYLPKRDKQADGYPRFDYPGVMNVYYVASMLPNSENISYSKSTQFIQGGAMATTTYAAAILAAVASLLF